MFSGDREKVHWEKMGEVMRRDVFLLFAVVFRMTKKDNSQL